MTLKHGKHIIIVIAYSLSFPFLISICDAYLHNLTSASDAPFPNWKFEKLLVAISDSGSVSKVQYKGRKDTYSFVTS